MSTPLTTSMEPQFRSIDGLKIRCADSGSSQESTVLLTSPWPESLYAFARMWASLAKHVRLLAIDPPGSEHPNAGKIFYLRERWADSLPSSLPTAAALFAAAPHPSALGRSPGWAS
jgi:hypothetical protein